MGGEGFIMQSIKSLRTNSRKRSQSNFDRTDLYHEKSKEPLKYKEFTPEEFKRFKQLLKVKRKKERTKTIIISIVVNVVFIYFLYWLFY